MQKKIDEKKIGPKKKIGQKKIRPKENWAEKNIGQNIGCHTHATIHAAVFEKIEYNIQKYNINETSIFQQGQMV
jgi:hypothetical protein